MWNGKFIHLRRVLSHPDSYYEFENGVAVPVTGMNETDEGQKSNGAGKSGLIEGVVVGLRGEPFRFKSAKDIIQDDEKDCEIDIELHNSLTDTTMRIYRKIARRGSGKVVLWINDQPRDDLKDLHPRETNKEIERLLGISFEDLANYYILSSEDHQPFFLTTDTKKKDTINRFSKANAVDFAIEEVKTEVNEIEQGLVQNERSQLKLEGQIDTYRTEIDALREKKDNLKDDYKEEIEDLESDIEEAQENLKQLTTDVKERQEAIDDLKNIEEQDSQTEIEKELAKIEKKMKKLDEEEAELTTEQTSRKKRKRSLSVVLGGELECPKCSHHFIPDSDVDPIAAKAELNEIDEDLEILTEDLEGIDEEKREFEESQQAYDTKLENIKKQQRLLERSENDLERAERRVENAKEHLDHLKQTLVLKQKSEPEDIYSEQIIDYEKKISEAKALLEELQQEYTAIEKQIESIKVWEGRFKHFKSHLANKAIKSIEGYTNHFLEKIHTNLQVQISGFRLLADGKTLKEEIEIEVLRDGLVAGKFKRFSGGEKARINICNILAMQQLINDTADSGGLDLLLLDEVTESLDYLGISEILHALNGLKRTVLLINHVRGEALENELVVCKRNGESLLGRVRREGIAEIFEPL